MSILIIDVGIVNQGLLFLVEWASADVVVVLVVVLMLMFTVNGYLCTI